MLLHMAELPSKKSALRGYMDMTCDTSKVTDNAEMWIQVSELRLRLWG